MQEVQTFTLLGEPLRIIRIVCRFGRNLLFDIPVIFLPTPPLALARPRLAIVFPATGPFPHILHTRDIHNSFLLRLE